MKSILVTGATGFIGRHTLALLRGRGFEVHALTSREIEDAAEDTGTPGVQWHRCDLLKATEETPAAASEETPAAASDEAPAAASHETPDPAPAAAPERTGASGELDEIMARARPSHLLHAAWQVQGWTRTGPEVHRPWLEASKRLLEAFDEAGGDRVVMVGTCTEYDWSHGKCSEFTTPRNPSTAYGEYKDKLRRHLEEYCGATDVSQSWGTVFFLFGPHQPEGSLVPSVIRSLLNGEVAECSSGEQQRDFLHVEDVARALVEMVDSDVEGPVNVGSGEATAVRDIVLRLADLLDGHELIRLGAIPAADQEPLVVADVTRLRDELGFQPRYDLEDGLKNTISWWRRRVEAGGGN